MTATKRRRAAGGGGRSRVLPGALGRTRSGVGLRIAVAVSRFNAFVGDRLLDGAMRTLTRHGVRPSDVTVVKVPGAFELPVVARVLAASGDHDAVVCLGAVIRGETPHFDLVAREAARGIARAAYDTGVPVLFGVLTTDTPEQALDRAGGQHGNKGAEAAEGALDMAVLLKSLRSGADA